MLLKGADVRRSTDFRVRTYLAYSASEQLAPGTREGARGAGEDPLRGPRRPHRTDEIAISELFDEDPLIGKETFRLARYLSADPVPVGIVTSRRLATVGRLVDAAD